MPTHNWNVLFDAGGQWTARNTGGNWDVGGVFHLGHRLTGIYLNQFYATHVNALGSSTANTDSTGAEVGYKLFYPWGQRWLTQGTGGYEFSSFDFENPPSDLGQTLFRTYIPGYGRWMTPDPTGGDVTNPQSLNRYAYVTNNPTSLTDPRVAHTSRRLRCMRSFFRNMNGCRNVSDVEWRDGPAETLLWREPPSLSDEEYLSPDAAV